MILKSEIGTRYFHKPTLRRFKTENHIQTHHKEEEQNNKVVKRKRSSTVKQENVYPTPILIHPKTPISFTQSQFQSQKYSSLSHKQQNSLIKSQHVILRKKPKKCDNETKKDDKLDVYTKKYEEIVLEEKKKKEAMKFVRRMQHQKQQIKGRLYYLKMKQEEKKKQKIEKQHIKNQIYFEEDKIKRLKQRAKMIDFYRQRTSQRKHLTRVSKISEKISSTKILEDAVEKNENKSQLFRRTQSQMKNLNHMRDNEEQQMEKVLKKIEVLRNFFKKPKH